MNLAQGLRGVALEPARECGRVDRATGLAGATRRDAGHCAGPDVRPSGALGRGRDGREADVGVDTGGWRVTGRGFSVGTPSARAFANGASAGGLLSSVSLRLV